jgi:hypothetical protein
MSGGHFQYKQYEIEAIAIEIDDMIVKNDEESKDQYGEYRKNNYPTEIIEKFKEASHTLKQAAEMAQRVDWLVSSDDGEKSFITRWAKEVRPYWNAERSSMDAYKNWWYYVGSGIYPLDGHDYEEHAKRVTEIAWKQAIEGYTYTNHLSEWLQNG